MANRGREKPIKERFDAAVAIIKTLPKDGPLQPSNTVKLRFYALYKQSMEGPCTLSKPSFWDAVGRAKWEAWSVCGKMSADLAMQMYIQELQQFVEAQPRTPEIEEFLKKIGPYDDAVPNSTNSTPAEGSGGGEGERGEGHVEEGGGAREEEGVSSDVETDHPSGQRTNNDRVHSDSEASEDFQDSFQEPPSVDMFGSDPSHQPQGPAQQQPHDHSHQQEPDSRSNHTQSAEVSISSSDMRPVVEQLLSVQSSLQAILQQLTSLVSSINTLPQPRPQPHPQHQGRVERLWRRRLFYRLLPFALGWPFIVQFVARFLIRRFGLSSFPWWVFSLVTFLHTMFAVAFLTASTHSPPPS